MDLPEVLLEIHVRTGFLDEFTHVSENEARLADLLDQRASGFAGLPGTVERAVTFQVLD